jgi:hypothetical protein
MARTESLGDKIKSLLPSKHNQHEKGYEPSEPSLPNYTVPADDEMYESDSSDSAFPKNVDQPREAIDSSLMQQPAYEENQIQLMSDIASDESLPVLTYYITNSQLGHKAQARLITRASAFQSKNQVFSNIIDQRDYQMAQDDYEFAKILSVADFTSFDLTTDYFTAEAIMESQFSIRIRRARKALNLLQLNTQRQESGQIGGYHQQQEKQGVLQKLSLLGGGGGGRY